jgi:hypothetical protein
MSCGTLNPIDGADAWCCVGHMIRNYLAIQNRKESGYPMINSSTVVVQKSESRAQRDP